MLVKHILRILWGRSTYIMAHHLFHRKLKNNLTKSFTYEVKVSNLSVTHILFFRDLHDFSQNFAMIIDRWIITNQKCIFHQIIELDPETKLHCNLMCKSLLANVRKFTLSIKCIMTGRFWHGYWLEKYWVQKGEQGAVQSKCNPVYSDSKEN